MTNEEFIRSISFEGEEWRDVVGYDYDYFISSMGRLVVGNKHWIDKNGILHKRAPKLLRPHINSFGYKVSAFIKNSKRVDVKIHKLVALYFIPNPNNYQSIDHIDRNKTNNHVFNLRWCNQSMNMSNPLTKLAMSKAKSIPIVGISPNGKFVFYKSASATSKDGFSPTSVTKVCKGKNQTHNGYRFMYLSEYETLIKSKNSLPNG